MIYRGFNERELKRITDILERNNVEFHVSVPTESLDHMNDPTKRIDHRFVDNLLQIEIETSEFDKISEKDIARLFDLRIYKEEESPFSEEEESPFSEEEESPFSEEELASLDTSNPTAPVKKADPNAKINQVAAISAVILVTLFFLWRHKII